jgi:5-formyltetrahydrofolate cyclo-ligase
MPQIDLKVQMRKVLKEIRKSIPQDKKHKADIEIISRFLMTKEYSDAELVLCYVSQKDEIDTTTLIYSALANGKKVGVPKCCGDMIDFYYIDSLDDLVVGSYGILEPDVKKCKRINNFTNSVLVAPGLGFSPDGNRIGYGKGYYDRFLANYKGTVVGLSYYNLVKLNIPTEETDCKINILITEKYTRNI